MHVNITKVTTRAAQSNLVTLAFIGVVPLLVLAVGIAVVLVLVVLAAAVLALVVMHIVIVPVIFGKVVVAVRASRWIRSVQSEGRDGQCLGTY